MDKNLLQFLNYKEPTKFNADDFFAKTSLAQELRKEAYNTSALVAQEAASGIGKAMSAIKPPLFLKPFSFYPIFSFSFSSPNWWTPLTHPYISEGSKALIFLLCSLASPFLDFRLLV